MPVDRNRKYRTRNGTDVRLVTDPFLHEGDQVVMGFVRDSSFKEGWRQYMWYAEHGASYWGCPPLDLVPVPKPPEGLILLTPPGSNADVSTHLDRLSPRIVLGVTGTTMQRQQRAFLKAGYARTLSENLIQLAEYLEALDRED